MGLPDWSEKELKALSLPPVTPADRADEPTRYVLFHTPLCGTCQAGRRMLEVVASMDPDLTIGQTNINLCRELPYDWQIESVPCLVKLERGVPTGKRYRMEGVAELYAWMRTT